MNLFSSRLVVFSLFVLFASSAPRAQDSSKLVYADFENMKDNRPVSNRGGLIQITSYQESPTMKCKFKGLEGSNPPAPEPVHTKKDDPNHAITFEFELPAANQYAGVGVEIQGGPEQDGKPPADDVSHYKFLTMQLYATGVSSIRVNFMSRGNGFKIGNGYPEAVFKVSPGFNTYKIPLASISQPSYAD